jgi:aspartate racemase
LAQARLWFLDQFEPGNAAYNLPSALRLRGALDVSALKQSLQEIVARHDVLRTTFQATATRVVQRVREPAELRLVVSDLRTLPMPEREATARQVAVEKSRQPFSLARDLLLRARLIRLGAEEHLLVLVLHQIAADGWSQAILHRELATLYDAFASGRPSPLPELPLQYADYAVWQRRQLQLPALQEELAYWKQHLQGAPAELNLPTDRPRPAVQSYRGARQTLVVDKELSLALRELSRCESVTLFTTLLAAFQVLLGRYSRQQDIVVGVPVAGRTSGELEGVIGLFENTLVLRTDLAGNPTFRELLRRVGETVRGAFAHQETPFENLVDELQPERTPNRSPLFQVRFTLQETPPRWHGFDGLASSLLAIDNATTRFDLTLALVTQGESLGGTLEYNTDLFEAATIGRLVGHFQVLLAGIIADPDRRLDELPLLTEAERHQLLSDWNRTEAEYPKEACIHHLFEAQVTRTPEAVAVVFGDEQVSYRELNVRANQLAHRLHRLDVGPETFVGLCLARSVELVVGVLGILKAGAAYVPLDPDNPPERLAQVVADAGLRYVVTHSNSRARLPQTVEPIVLPLEADPGPLEVPLPAFGNGDQPWVEHETAPSCGVQPSNLCYLLYTSGSTGSPKGVAIEHRAVVNVLESMRRSPGLQCSDILLAIAPLTFDIAALELFLPLLVGARLVLASNEMRADGALLRTQLLRHGVTVMQATPTGWHMLLAADGPWPRSLKPLCGGEPLPPDVASDLIAKVGLVWNLYGPTETTIWSTAGRLDKQGEAIHIGRPIANTQVYVLNAALQPTPIGVPGELYIGGIGLARGYWNRPELTAEQFLPDPFRAEPGARLYKTGDLVRWRADGNLEFLGRLDQQIKLRGFRIEPGEIEAALAQHPQVREAVVRLREDRPGDKRLVAYVVARQEPGPAPTELRRFLEQKLPVYMVPSAFVLLDCLPLTPSGKLDRRALPAPEADRPELTQSYAPPRTPVEEMLASIWSEVLGLEKVGIHDNFFDLGGDSLRAVRLFIHIEKTFGTKLPLAILFQGATIEQLAKVLQNPIARKSETQLVAIHPSGSRPPLFFFPSLGNELLYCRGLAQYLGPDQPVYGIQPCAPDGERPPAALLETIATDCLETLRSFQSHGPYCLAGYSFAGTIAFEIARQLAAEGQEVKFLGLIDTDLPHPEYQSVRGGIQALSACLLNLPAWLLYDFLRTPPRKLLARIGRYAKGIRKRDAQTLENLELEKLFDTSQLSDHYRDLIATNLRLLHNYRPGPYSGRVTLFRARAQPLFRKHGADLGWGKIARGGLVIRSIPGTHESILNEPYVRGLAKEFKAALDSV